jgi:hypothetical protein
MITTQKFKRGRRLVVKQTEYGIWPAVVMLMHREAMCYVISVMGHLRWVAPVVVLAN